MTGVAITLDKPRTLRYGLNAMCALEDAGVMVASAADLAKPTRLRAVLWAGLIHEDPTLTQEQVGAMVENISDIGRVARAVVEAFAQSQPDPEPGRRPRKAQR